jgi:hypothetical protein
MQEEIWKDIPGYEGLYQVSNLGNIKSLSREIKRNGFYISKEKILKHNVNNGGYLYVNLFKDKIGKTKYIHSLVAIAFLNHIPNGTQEIVVDHIDSNKKNNRLDNLQLITQRENTSKLKRGVSKYTGVCWCKKERVFKASILIDKKRINLGSFKCETSAHLAYQNKLKQII